VRSEERRRQCVEPGAERGSRELPPPDGVAMRDAEGKQARQAPVNSCTWCWRVECAPVLVNPKGNGTTRFRGDIFDKAEGNVGR